MLSTEQIAQVCHAANRELQIIQGDPAVSPAWGDAPDWQRESAVAGVKAATGDAEAGVAGKDPEGMHEAWMAARVADGWTYGEVKDAHAKTHPCLVPYDQLPDGQKTKDALFLGVVGAFTEPG